MGLHEPGCFLLNPLAPRLSGSLFWHSHPFDEDCQKFSLVLFWVLCSKPVQPHPRLPRRGSLAAVAAAGASRSLSPTPSPIPLLALDPWPPTNGEGS